MESNPAVVLGQGLPYALALMAILSIHELGHYLVAKSYKMRTTLPYFIPVPPLEFLSAKFILGTFGAFIQMRSPVPNRKALFDVGIAGPLAGFVVTIPLLIWGLAHSSVVQLSEASRLFNFESLNPRFSLLLTLLSKLALGSQFTPEMAIHLHPVAIAGYIGLIVTALNLMPVGQLDGGHIVHAMFGQRTGAAIGQITRLLMLLLALLEPDLILWAIILLFMPVADEPALNDVSELDNWRDLWGLLALVILVSIVLPPPATITGLLNI
jgi:membrane-associated protease RseP (regulator of RpoE activity)